MLNSSIDVGLHGTEAAHLLLTRQPRVWFSAFPRIFFLLLLRFLTTLLWTVDRGLIRYVNQTHLVLARGKWILQKTPESFFSWTLSLDLKLRKLSKCQSQKMPLLSNNERSWTHFRVFVVRKANWSGNGHTRRYWQFPQLMWEINHLEIITL